MRRIILLLAIAPFLGSCDLMRTYYLTNPATGQHATCMAWANSPFQAGASNDPGPFRHCIEVCKASGFVPPPDAEAIITSTSQATDKVVPPECAKVKL